MMITTLAISAYCARITRLATGFGDHLQRIYTQLGYDSFSKRWQGNQIFYWSNLC